MTEGSKPVGLVVGASGVIGRAACQELTSQGWEVLGLSRRGPVDIAGVTPILVDLTDTSAVHETLRAYRPTHVFLTAWIKHATEAENINVNGRIVRNVLDALSPAGSVRHVALVTGLKHYLGPFEAYGKGLVRETPWHEDEERLPYPNFYYQQEDEVWEAAARDGFTWSVHRAHSVIGYAVGNAMNMGQSIAAAAAICRETGRPFVFPGSETQWNKLVDMTDARLLAEHMHWAATEPRAANQALNIINGDVFRWRWMWPRLSAALGLEGVGFEDKPRTFVEQMADAGPIWVELAERYGLRETELSRVASFWHTDADLGRDTECVADMSLSRELGFTGYRTTLKSFLDLFTQLEQNNVVPPASAP